MRLTATVGALVLASIVGAQAADPALSDQANVAFLAANAKKAGVTVEPDGLQYRIIHAGFGKRPKASDMVTVNYKGMLINGKVFDATEPGLPAQFQANKLIPGWTEALQLMREGDEWELVIPASLAYGSHGAGGGAIPPNQALVFNRQLISVIPPPKDQKSDQDQSQ